MHMHVYIYTYICEWLNYLWEGINKNKNLIQIKI